MSRFDNKVIFLTGASSGIGAATAKRLAGEGAAVFGTGRSEQGLAQTEKAIVDAGGIFQPFASDITGPQACRDAIAACVEHFERLDVLVNCAGCHVFRALHEISDELWFEDLATNLGGAFFLSQAAMPHLLASGGNIVSIGLLASVQGQPYSATYCSAKHGLIGLTRALALEYMNRGIRINAICPGGTDTPQIQKVGMPDGANIDLIMRTAGLRGFSQAEDIASVIAFMASDDAKGVHGAVYMVDQGKTVG